MGGGGGGGTPWDNSITYVAVTEKRAEVFFIDYGNKDIVSMETLLTLPPHYMDTPVQVGVVTRLT